MSPIQFVSRRASLFVLALLIALAFLFSPAPTLASATTRYVAITGTDTGKCAKSSAPCRTILYAVNHSVAGDKIMVGAGTYHEVVTIPISLTIVGHDSSDTLLDGGGTLGNLVTVASGATVKVTNFGIQNAKLVGDTGAAVLNSGNLTLLHINIQHNHTGGGSSPNDNGAGIYNQGKLKVKFALIVDNQADNNGGAFYNTPSHSMNISNAIIETGSALHGGAIYNESGTVTVKNSSILQNSATASGGAIYNYNSGATMTLTDVDLNMNTAPGNGGAIANYLGPTLTLSDSISSQNHANNGGFIWNGQDAHVTLNDAMLDNNTAVTSGGGLYNSQSSTSALLTNVTIKNSTAPDGAAIYNESSASATLTNVTLGANTASHFGGGLSNTNGASATLTNVTLSSNSASAGGDLYNTGTATLKNTILANATAGGNCGGNVVISHGHNLDSANNCALTGSHDQINTDPQLMPLGPNGGIADTFALPKTSPAVDKGANKGCPTTDERGKNRPFDGDGNGKAVCDIGAYEYQP